MTKPLYGALAAEVGVGRRLIEMYIGILANRSWIAGEEPDFNSAVATWMERVARISPAKHRDLGRVLILEWNFQYGLDS